MAAAAILNFGKMSITPDWIKISAPNFTGIVEASNFKFGTQLGFETSLPKNHVLVHNWQGSGPGEQPKKIWDPLRIFATVTQIGFGTSLPENNVLDQNWRGLGQGSIQKSWDPLPIFATAEASD